MSSSEEEDAHPHIPYLEGHGPKNRGRKPQRLRWGQNKSRGIEEGPLHHPPRSDSTPSRPIIKTSSSTASSAASSRDNSVARVLPPLPKREGLMYFHASDEERPLPPRPGHITRRMEEEKRARSATPSTIQAASPAPPGPPAPAAPASDSSCRDEDASTSSPKKHRMLTKADHESRREAMLRREGPAPPPPEESSDDDRASLVRSLPPTRTVSPTVHTFSATERHHRVPPTSSLHSVPPTAPLYRIPPTTRIDAASVQDHAQQPAEQPKSFDAVANVIAAAAAARAREVIELSTDEEPEGLGAPRILEVNDSDEDIKPPPQSGPPSAQHQRIPPTTALAPRTFPLADEVPATAISDDVMEIDESLPHTDEPDDDVTAADSAIEERQKSPAKTSSTTIGNTEAIIAPETLADAAAEMSITEKKEKKQGKKVAAEADKLKREGGDQKIVSTPTSRRAPRHAIVTPDKSSADDKDAASASVIANEPVEIDGSQSQADVPPAMDSATKEMKTSPLKSSSSAETVEAQVTAAETSTAERKKKQGKKVATEADKLKMDEGTQKLFSTPPSRKNPREHIVTPVEPTSSSKLSHQPRETPSASSAAESADEDKKQKKEMKKKRMTEAEKLAADEMVEKQQGTPSSRRSLPKIGSPQKESIIPEVKREVGSIEPEAQEQAESSTVESGAEDKKQKKKRYRSEADKLADDEGVQKMLAEATSKRGARAEEKADSSAVESGVEDKKKSHRKSEADKLREDEGIQKMNAETTPSRRASAAIRCASKEKKEKDTENLDEEKEKAGKEAEDERKITEQKKADEEKSESSTVESGAEDKKKSKKKSEADKLKEDEGAQRIIAEMATTPSRRASTVIRDTSKERKNTERLGDQKKEAEEEAEAERKRKEMKEKEEEEKKKAEIAAEEERKRIEIMEKEEEERKREEDNSRAKEQAESSAAGSGTEKKKKKSKRKTEAEKLEEDEGVQILKKEEFPRITFLSSADKERAQKAKEKEKERIESKKREAAMAAEAEKRRKEEEAANLRIDEEERKAQEKAEALKKPAEEKIAKELEEKERKARIQLENEKHLAKEAEKARKVAEESARNMAGDAEAVERRKKHMEELAKSELLNRDTSQEGSSMSSDIQLVLKQEAQDVSLEYMNEDEPAALSDAQLPVKQEQALSEIIIVVKQELPDEDAFEDVADQIDAGPVVFTNVKQEDEDPAIDGQEMEFEDDYAMYDVGRVKNDDEEMDEVVSPRKWKNTSKKRSLSRGGRPASSRDHSRGSDEETSPRGRNKRKRRTEADQLGDYEMVQKMKQAPPHALSRASRMSKYIPPEDVSDNETIATNEQDADFRIADTKSRKSAARTAAVERRSTRLQATPQKNRSVMDESEQSEGQQDDVEHEIDEASMEKFRRGLAAMVRNKTELIYIGDMSLISDPTLASYNVETKEVEIEANSSVMAAILKKKIPEGVDESTQLPQEHTQILAELRQHLTQDYQKVRDAQKLRRKEAKAIEKKRMQEELYMDDHELDEAPEQPGCSQAMTTSLVQQKTPPTPKEMPVTRRGGARNKKMRLQPEYEYADGEVSSASSEAMSDEEEERPSKKDKRRRVILAARQIEKEGRQPVQDEAVQEQADTDTDANRHRFDHDVSMAGDDMYAPAERDVEARDAANQRSDAANQPERDRDDFSYSEESDDEADYAWMDEPTPIVENSQKVWCPVCERHEIEGYDHPLQAALYLQPAPPRPDEDPIQMPAFLVGRPLFEKFFAFASSKLGTIRKYCEAERNDIKREMIAYEEEVIELQRNGEFLNDVEPAKRDKTLDGLYIGCYKEAQKQVERKRSIEQKKIMMLKYPASYDGITQADLELGIRMTADKFTDIYYTKSNAREVAEMEQLMIEMGSMNPGRKPKSSFIKIRTSWYPEFYIGRSILRKLPAEWEELFLRKGERTIYCNHPIDPYEFESYVRCKNQENYLYKQQQLITVLGCVTKDLLNSASIADILHRAVNAEMHVTKSEERLIEEQAAASKRRGRRVVDSARSASGRGSRGRGRAKGRGRGRH